MNSFYKIILIFIFISLSSCTNIVFLKKTVQENVPFADSFDNNETFHNNWEDDSFGNPKSYKIEKNNLKITTRPNSKDRIKVKTKRNDFGLGTYEWNIFIPTFKINDQCSVGAFIYHEGKTPYEIDIEVGSGNKEDREKVKAKPNEVIVHCTSQFKPYSSGIFKVNTEKWHNFKIELTEKNNKYLIKWYINNTLVKTLQSKIRIKHKFTVHNSLENLAFMGNNLPTKQNFVLFNSFTYK